MALPDSALSELLDALRVGNGTDLVRDLAQWTLQALIDTEAAERIGAGRYERTDDRVTHRNGTRPRTLSTKAGDLQIGIPKLRAGSYLPSLLEPRRRIDQALYAVVMEAYVNGVSTRSVDDLVAALGVDSGISKSEVSRICAGLDERVDAFRNRTLGHIAFPYVYLDATYLNVRDDALGQVVSRAVVVATGITAEGGREVLGVDIGDSEDETFWTRFLRSLKARGLNGVRLVISDAHAGLKASIRKSFQGASWQRCKVHYVRNLLAVVPKGSQEMVSAVFRSIFTLTTPGEVCARWDEVTDTLADRFPKAAESMRNARTDVLAFTAFPAAHWRKIWSNNPLERLNKEIKRRSNVVGIFPNDPAVIRLIGAVLADQHDEWQVARRYLSDTSMTELASSTPVDAASTVAAVEPATSTAVGVAAAVNEG
ncbi:MAG TPA: IS256 family transposase [Microthrixaceae bacterium]|jgi:putative transposase|nr:IS256 family transposase [Microthrixaceae bacterium]